MLVVATDGKDRAAGTARHPLATVAAAVRRLPAGGTVLLRGGRYDERVSLGRPCTTWRSGRTRTSTRSSTVRA